MRRNTQRASRPMAIVLALIIGLASTLTVSSSAAAQSAERRWNYSPATGVLFNNPNGTKAGKSRIMRHLIKSINSAPRRSIIKMAVYSFAHPDVADALVRAHKRGVTLKLVFSGENVYDPVRRLRRVLGSNTSKKSFAIICDNSCRGTRGQMHAKYFSFRRAGDAQFVTMVGSVNLTRYNAERQWNDLYTVANDKAYYQAYNRWFKQLKSDRPVDPTYMARSAGPADIQITPLNRKYVADPILGALGRIRCQVPMGEIDPASPTPDVLVPTKIMIAAHAWNDARGRTLALKVAELARAGCAVRVFYGVGTGPYVKEILKNAGIPVVAGTHKGIRTHQKLMIVAGGFDADPQTIRVWTGSSNWSDAALARDDLIVQINDQVVGQSYVDNYEWMWANG